MHTDDVQPVKAQSDRNLRLYWTHGEGAIKIRWGTPGDFGRCVRQLRKYVADPKGLCAEYHHEATGEWPGQHAGRERGKHLPGRHAQETHGNDVAAINNPLDKLGLAKRIQLGPGEKLVSSRKIRTASGGDSFDLLMAEVDTPNGRQIRLGIIDPDDSLRWAAGPDLRRARRVADLDRRIEALENQPDDLSDSAFDRLEELREERRDHGADGAEELNRTAIIHPASIAQLRTDLQAAGERAREWSKNWNKFWDDHADESDEHEALRHIPEGRRTPQQQARYDELTASFDEIGGPDPTFAEGHFPGGTEGDLAYLVEGKDDGEGGWDVRLGVKPPGAPEGWYVGYYDDQARLGPKELTALLGELEDEDDGQKRGRRVRVKHLPGQHNQLSHAGNGILGLLDGLDMFDGDDYNNEFGDTFDEQSVESIGLTVRLFESGDAHLVSDLGGGDRYQPLGALDDSEAMRDLAGEISNALRIDVSDLDEDDEDDDGLVYTTTDLASGVTVGRYASGDVRLKPEGTDDFLDLSEDEADELTGVLSDMADTWDENFEHSAGAKSCKHLPGLHDQSLHGRRRPKLPGVTGRNAAGSPGESPSGPSPNAVAASAPAARSTPAAYASPTSTPTRMTRGQYTRLLKDEHIRLQVLDGKTEKEARAAARPAASIDDLKVRNGTLRRRLRDQGIDYRTEQQLDADEVEKSKLLDEVEELAGLLGHEGPSKRAGASHMSVPALRKFIADGRDFHRRRTEAAQAARRGQAEAAAHAERVARRRASPRQVDYIMNLLALRRRSGEGGGFMTGPADRAGIAKMSQADASTYIDSLRGDY